LSGFACPYIGITASTKTAKIVAVALDAFFMTSSENFCLQAFGLATGRFRALKTYNYNLFDNHSKDFYQK
jgi:hypothetical protein